MIVVADMALLLLAAALASIILATLMRTTAHTDRTQRERNPLSDPERRCVSSRLPRLGEDDAPCGRSACRAPIDKGQKERPCNYQQGTHVWNMNTKRLEWPSH